MNDVETKEPSESFELSETTETRNHGSLFNDFGIMICDHPPHPARVSNDRRHTFRQFISCFSQLQYGKCESIGSPYRYDRFGRRNQQISSRTWSQDLAHFVVSIQVE